MSENVSRMNPVAKMGFVPQGIYSNTKTYDFLDFVYYNGNSYVAKKLTVGNEPQESNEYWQILAKGGIEDVGIQFQEATERKNIQSGEDTPTLFGKIKKWFVDLKAVAWSGDYIDLSNKPTIPAAVAVKGNAESAYRTGNVNLTPANIGAVATTKVLTTKEQINANTDTSNVAGATAVKTMVGEINSNLYDKVPISFLNSWEWTSGTGVGVINEHLVSINVGLKEGDCTANKIIAQLPVKYAPKVWTIVFAACGRNSAILLPFVINITGDIYCTKEIPEDYFVLNATWEV